MRRWIGLAVVLAVILAVGSAARARTSDGGEQKMDRNADSMMDEKQ
jgi:hypothetical protein